MGKSWNLESFDNIYADLAQSAYNGRPASFSYEELLPNLQKRLDSDQSVEINYNEDAQDPDKGDNSVTRSGQHFDSTDPNNDGIVYLQPDQKGLLEDKEIGYNAYYLSENETINQDTHQTYFAVRGSDGFGQPSLEHPEHFKHPEDWITNDAAFALQDKIIPQAKEATKGMAAKIAELNEKAAPDAKMSITGHSLGTIVSAQAVANLSYDEFV